MSKRRKRVELSVEATTTRIVFLVLFSPEYYPEYKEPGLVTVSAFEGGTAKVVASTQFNVDWCEEERVGWSGGASVTGDFPPGEYRATVQLARRKKARFGFTID